MALSGISLMNAGHAEVIVSPKTLTRGESGYFEYGIYQEQAAALPYVTCVSVNDCPERTVKTLVSKVVPVKSVEPIAARSQSGLVVHFDFAKSNLKKSEKALIKANLAQWRARGTFTLRAWTDPVGGVGSKANIRLAKARAESVKRYLKANGIRAHYEIAYNPPCCTRNDATANSPEEVRREMRVVEID